MTQVLCVKNFSSNLHGENENHKEFLFRVINAGTSVKYQMLYANQPSHFKDYAMRAFGSKNGNDKLNEFLQ